MSKKVYYLKEQEPSAEASFGKIIHEIMFGGKTDSSDSDFPLIAWVYRWGGNKTAYSYAFKRLIAIYMWEN
jgi:hypothetical protein